VPLSVAAHDDPRLRIKKLVGRSVESGDGFLLHIDARVVG
jgi:hypothetical protein